MSQLSKSRATASVDGAKSWHSGSAGAATPMNYCTACNFCRPEQMALTVRIFEESPISFSLLSFICCRNRSPFGDLFLIQLAAFALRHKRDNVRFYFLFTFFHFFFVGAAGPTTAAGAIGSAQVVEDFLMMFSDENVHRIDDFVRKNDSYNFYANLCDGKYHVITGHTGTNVMDLHILHFSP